MSRMYALVDANSFFCSCERAMNPALRGKAVVVLSNNDGVVVAATKEAKALGAKRGEPYFKIRGLEKAGKLAVFSSNYELYGDLSERMMRAVASAAPQIIQYSIDECFAVWDGAQNLAPWAEWGAKLKSRVMRRVGIPVCVGLAPSKTLAKLCCHLAKSHERFGGVLRYGDLPRAEFEALIGSEPVGEIWGIGPRVARRLNALGIWSALDFARSDPHLIQGFFPLPVRRTRAELDGLDLIDLGDPAAGKKQIISSRSFGQCCSDMADIRAAVAYHVRLASAKLRAQGGVAGKISVYAYPNRFRPDWPARGFELAARLDPPQSAFPPINVIAQGLVESGFAPGSMYKKCGVALFEIEPARRPVQAELFGATDPRSGRADALQSAIDRIGRRFGKNTLFLGDEARQGDWRMKRGKLSPVSPRSLAGLPVID